MSPRTADILEASVRSFIELGEPISSGWLYDHFDFGIKPAMIRLELNDLTDHGFLEQPHYSAGRIPRNRAYEFFAERILGRQSQPHAIDRELRATFCGHEWRGFTERFSRELKLLGVTLSDDEVLKDGLDRLVGHLDWETRREIMGVIQDFEDIDDRLPETTTFDDDVRVFIGHKSPVTRSEHLAVVAGEYMVNGTRVKVLAVGPKRMDYEKVITMFRALQAVAEQT